MTDILHKQKPLTQSVFDASRTGEGQQVLIVDSYSVEMTAQFGSQSNGICFIFFHPQLQGFEVRGCHADREVTAEKSLFQLLLHFLVLLVVDQP